MLPIDNDGYLKDLQPAVYENLIYELDKNSTWKTIANYLANTAPEIYHRSWVNSLDRIPNSVESPAELVLIALRKISCNVEFLCAILRKLNLRNALYILDGYEELVIKRQYAGSNERIPLEIELGETLSITCEATGSPPPQYQWYHGNVEIPDQTSSTLTLPIISLDQEGEYQCIVSQYNRDEKLIVSKYSEYVLTIKPTCVEIIKQPASARVKIGESLILNCTAKGHPNLQYQWYKDNQKLDEQHSSTLQIRPFRREDKGRYYCIASNGFSDAYSETSEVIVDYAREKATIKIALLIANSDYNDARLPIAVNDAATIAEKLKKINFHVICLQNLTLNEMKRAIELFCSFLHRGAYGLFYFVGHGFELHGRYMMPVDVPQTFCRKHTIAEDQLLQSISKNDPALFVVILDMCLKVPSKLNKELYNEVPEVWEYHFNSDPIRVYSTSNYNPSYEPKTGDNGIYVSHLAKHITDNKPVEQLFTEVAEAVRDSLKDEISNQKPMITTIPKTPNRYLTDAVLNDGKSSKLAELLNNLTTFKQKTIEVAFLDGKVLGQVTIQPLKSPHLNAIRLTTSGLENWDVKFSCHNKRVVLDHKGTECHVYNPQRISSKPNRRLLRIQLRKNGTKYVSTDFSYIEHVPDILAMLSE